MEQGGETACYAVMFGGEKALNIKDRIANL